MPENFPGTAVYTLFDMHLWVLKVVFNLSMEAIGFGNNTIKYKAAFEFCMDNNSTGAERLST